MVLANFTKEKMCSTEKHDGVINRLHTKETDKHDDFITCRQLVSACDKHLYGMCTVIPTENFNFSESYFWYDANS